MKIGKFSIDPPVVLAPMAGVTDFAFRNVCRAFGAGMTVTEMASSRALVYQDKKTNNLLRVGADEHPVAVQIFGNDPELMAKAAVLALERSGADILDLNMGCPTPKIVNNGDGSALMRDPARVEAIVRAVVEAVAAPVTVKFRLGWDRSEINVLECARRAEQAGVSAICIHGRTKKQMYSGRADWSEIRTVVGAVSVPVVVNGDIFSPKDAADALKKTGAAGVMIGRAAFGNPWIFAQVKAMLAGEAIPALPPLAERLNVALRQIECAAEDKGERVAVLEARKHLAWYLRGVHGANFYKDRLFSLSTLEEVGRFIRQLQRELH